MAVMAERDYALALLAATDEIPSRTMLQKLVYLMGAGAEDRLSFTAHFYGPYSASLQDEVARLVASGLVSEDASQLEPWEPTPFDVMQYRYQLTENGQKAAEALPPPILETAEKLIGAARDVGAWNQASLSMAAKLHHLRQIDPDVGDADVPALASQFGWRMSEGDARRGARLLDTIRAEQ